MPQSLIPLTSSEVAGVVTAARSGRRPLLDGALVSLALDAGPRRSELRHIRYAAGCDRPVVAVGQGDGQRLIRFGSHTEAALAQLAAWPGGAGQPHPAGVFACLIPTDWGIHERLLQVGVRAGIRGSLTMRRLRRTWLATILDQGLLREEVIATLVDHHPEGIERAPALMALRAQFAPGWRSPLDKLLEAERIERAA